MLPLSYISPDYLIRAITTMVNDEEFKNGLTRGWYMTQLKWCLNKFAFQTYFDKHTQDFTIGGPHNEVGSGLIFVQGHGETPLDHPDTEQDGDVDADSIGGGNNSWCPPNIKGDIDPKVLQLHIPTGIYNIEEMYVWNGFCCSPQSSQPVYWKRQYNNMPYGGTGYTSTRVGNNLNLDPFQPFMTLYPFIWDGNLLWFSVQDGVLMLSPSVAGWENLRIVYSGTAGSIGECPVIPQYFEEAMKDYGILQFCEAMMHRGKKGYQELYTLKKDDLFNSRTGTWWEAQNRVKRMSSIERQSLKEYLAKGNW